MVEYQVKPNGCLTFSFSLLIIYKGRVVSLDPPFFPFIFVLVSIGSTDFKPGSTTDPPRIHYGSTTVPLRFHHEPGVVPARFQCRNASSHRPTCVPKTTFDEENHNESKGSTRAPLWLHCHHASSHQIRQMKLKEGTSPCLIQRGEGSSFNF